MLSYAILSLYGSKLLDLSKDSFSKTTVVKYRTGINSDSICEVKFWICSSINQLGTISGMDTCQCRPADGGNMTIRSRVSIVCTTILTIIHYTVLYNTIL